jgi:hypothetical protein
VFKAQTVLRAPPVLQVIPEQLVLLVQQAQLLLFPVQLEILVLPVQPVQIQLFPVQLEQQVLPD